MKPIANKAYPWIVASWPRNYARQVMTCKRCGVVSVYPGKWNSYGRCYPRWEEFMEVHSLCKEEL